MKTTKRIFAFLLAGIMCVSLAACAGQKQTADNGKKKIGACIASLAFDFQLKMNNGIKRCAEEKGYEYVPYDYNMDAEKMLTGLDTLKASNVGAMYGLFLAPESAADFMKNNPEIGVLTQGGIAPGAQAGTLNDYKKLGEQFVESLDNHVKANNITEGSISALWLEVCENQDSEYYTAKEDIKAIINKWCEGTNFHFEGEYYPKDDEAASNTTTQILNSDPDCRFIFAFNNGYAIAAANEISSAKSDTKDFFVFSSEGDEETFRCIKDEKNPLRGCAYMDIEKSGYDVGLQLINWVETGKMENVIVVKDLVDSRNVGDYIK